MGKTRDLFKKIRDTKGNFHSKMGTIKDRNGMDLIEAEDTKKRWQEYTEELYKKDLHEPDNHDAVIIHLKPDILECEVKWALGSITTNTASGGDGIPVELVQILKDDAVKVLHSICQQIWKTQQWPQDWKRSVFIPIPKKGNAKECSNYRTIALISHCSKIMLKILQARLQQYMNRETPDVQVGFRKASVTRDQIANICWIIKKAREFQKNIYFCFIDYAKAFDYVDLEGSFCPVGDGSGWLGPSPLKLSLHRCLMNGFLMSVQFSQSHLTLCNPMDCSTPGSLSITNSESLLKLMSIESVMPSNYLFLCHPLLLQPSIFLSIRVFSNESVLHIRWPKYWSFNFNISPSSKYSGLIFFRMYWLDLAVQGTLKSLLQHQFKSINSSALSFGLVQLSHPYMTTGKTIALTRWTFVSKVTSLIFNMLSRLVIIFLPRSKHLLISWLQPPSAVILKHPPK